MGYAPRRCSATTCGKEMAKSDFTADYNTGFSCILAHSERIRSRPGKAVRRTAFRKKDHITQAFLHDRRYVLREYICCVLTEYRYRKTTGTVSFFVCLQVVVVSYHRVLRFTAPPILFVARCFRTKNSRHTVVGCKPLCECCRTDEPFLNQFFQLHSVAPSSVSCFSMP